MSQHFMSAFEFTAHIMCSAACQHISDQTHGQCSILNLFLPTVPPNVSVPLLSRIHSAADVKAEAASVLPLYATLATAWPLTTTQWQQVPFPCPGLGTALPAVLARSQAEAALLVHHLPAADRSRLRTAALALHRLQRCLKVSLPTDLAHRILAQFDA